MPPLISLDSVSLAFGHVPLLEGATLLVEPGERMALIGRNGAGKSSLLRMLSGEVPPDSGTLWRAPGLRVARLDQDIPGEGARTVFDEISAGLGPLGDLVAEYHRTALRVAEAPDDEAALERLG